MDEKVPQLISDSKNICLIPSENEPESVSASLALFYTLKELGKNVNFIIENFPQKLNFLIPSPDFISSPKNLVITIPKDLADISQIYYEKNDSGLKINLTIDHGHVKKDEVSFHYAQTQPDLIITLGIKDFKNYLESTLDSFGYLLGAPIVNIDSLNPLLDNAKEEMKNKMFGQINIIENRSLTQLAFDFISSIKKEPVDKNAINCLFAGLLINSKTFKRAGQEIFELAGRLIKLGAEQQKVTDYFLKTNEQDLNFLTELLRNLQPINPPPSSGDLSVAIINSQKFQNLSQKDVPSLVEKIKTIGLEQSLLVLWPSHASGPTIKGFLYSKKPDLIKRLTEGQSTNNSDWVFISLPETDINLAKEKLLKSLTFNHRPTD